MKKLLSALLASSYLLLAVHLPISAATDTPTDSGIVPNCSGSVDMSKYIGCTPKTECDEVVSTAKGDTYSHECSVTNKVEWIDAFAFKQYSNNIHFLYQTTGAGVSFLQDTIWGGMSCDGGGDAIYRVYKDAGTWGAEQFSLNNPGMSCGGIFDKPASYLKTYNKTKMKNDGIDIDGADYNKNIDAYNCNVAGQSGVTSGGSTQLIFEGQAQCCTGELQDIAVIRNVTGPGAGEVYMYCAGKGLCAHYQSLNFADEKNNPQNWGPDTDLCALSAGSDKDEYYLYPVEGINSQNQDAFYDDLVQQGYQSYCYVPTEELQGKLDLDKNWIYDRSGFLDAPSEQKYDYSDAEVPLWRNLGKLKELGESGLIGMANLFDSLEAYWGSRNVEEEDRFLKDISSAPIYSLISKEDQCIQKTKLLVAVEELCKKLESPATCALDKIIPAAPTRNNQGFRAQQGTDPDGNAIQEASGYTFLKLLNDMRLNNDFTCDKFGKNDFSDEKSKELAEVLDNVPFYLDKAYRLGFLVVAAEVHDGPDGPPPLAFNFLPFNLFTNSGDKSGDMSKHNVRIVAFKLPDIGTNKDPNDPGYYQDAIELTANSVLGNDYIKKYQEQIEAEKAMDTLPYASGLINAMTTDYYNESQLVQALVKFVNKRNNNTAYYAPHNYNPGDTKALCGIDRNSKPKVEDLPIDPPAEDSDSYRIIDKTGLYQGEDDKESDRFRVVTDGGGNIMENLEEQFIFQEYPPGSQTPITNNQTTSAEDDTLDQELIRSGEEELEEESVSVSDNPWAFKFLSRFSLADDANEKSAKDPKIFTYIVIPQGYQLAAAEEALSGLIYSYEDKKTLMANMQEVPPFLKLQNTGLRFFSEPGKAGAIDPSLSDNPATPEDERQVDIIASVKLKEGVRTIDLEPRILGGRLGYITRKIQESLHQANSKMGKWLASLTSTEEYLLALGSDEELAGEHKNPICAYDGGYKIESESLRELISDAAGKYGSSIEMMSITIAGENCKHAGEATNICTKSDDFYSKGDFLDKSKTYVYEGEHFNGCPEKTGNYVGPFRLNAFYYPNSWEKVALNGNNPCSVHDNIYALAKYLSGSDTLESKQMKANMVKWVLGSPSTETGGQVTCQSAMDAADKYPNLKGEDEICDIRIATGDCVKKEWLWAVGAYCCAVDHVFGDAPGNYCTTDTWLNDITPVKAEACQ